MQATLQHFLINKDASIIDAIKVIDKAASGGGCVIDPNMNFLGMVTDGDIRRALIDGANLNEKVFPYTNKNCTTVSPEASRTEALDLMQARFLQQIPIIDIHHKLVGIHTLKQLLGCNVRPNWAVVMAGGKGTRLRPITENIPKPMVPVAGRPILERIVLHLVGFGIRRIFLSVNYLSHIIEEHFQDGLKFGCQIEYLHEDQPLGTGGALSLLPETPENPVLVMNGDLIVQSDFNRMLQFHQDGNYHATMALRPYTHEVAFGCAEIEDDRLIQLEEKPVLTKLVNAGIYVLSPDAVEQVPENTFYPITQLFETALTDNLPCGAYVMEEDWMDIGQPHQLRKANGWS
jgi:dTDP-glucose pyrophosphorylase